MVVETIPAAELVKYDPFVLSRALMKSWNDTSDHNIFITSPAEICLLPCRHTHFPLFIPSSTLSAIWEHGHYMEDLQSLVDLEFSYLVKINCVGSVSTERKKRSFILSVGVFPRRKNFPTEVSEYGSLISLLKSSTVGENILGQLHVARD